MEPSPVIATARHRSGVVHESFFVESGANRIWATLYLPPDQLPRRGVVFCVPWGVEALTMLEWTQRLAHDVALGGVAVVLPQWPGTADSHGDPDTMTLPCVLDAAKDTVAAVRDRLGPSLTLAGLRVGAAIATLLSVDVPADRLLLVQPALDFSDYFAKVERRARRARLGAITEDGFAFGHPHPSGLQQPEAAAEVDAALTRFRGRGAVVRYRRPALPAPDGFRTVIAWGDWRRPPRVDHGPLRIEAQRWLCR